MESQYWIASIFWLVFVKIQSSVVYEIASSINRRILRKIELKITKYSELYQEYTALISFQPAITCPKLTIETL